MTEETPDWKKTEEQLRNECDTQIDEHYKRKRAEIEKYFTLDRAQREKARASISPGGKYVLVITPYFVREGCWTYSRGQVFLTKDYLTEVPQDREGIIAAVKDVLYDEAHKVMAEPVADIKRNYSRFPFGWLESHPDGHDYLVCGEDYQGISVCQLDTGETRHTADSLMVKGWGWCHAAFYPAPNKQLLAASGCVWAGPYSVRFYDFRKPMELPWPLIKTVHDENECQPWGMDPDDPADDYESTAFVVTHEVEIRKSDGKPIYELSEEEEEALDNSEDDDYDYKTVSVVISQEDLMEELNA